MVLHLRRLNRGIRRFLHRLGNTVYFSLSSNRNKIVDFVHRRDWTRVNGVIVNIKEIRGSTWFDRNQFKKETKEEGREPSSKMGSWWISEKRRTVVRFVNRRISSEREQTTRYRQSFIRILIDLDKYLMFIRNVTKKKEEETRIEFHRGSLWS